MVNFKSWTDYNKFVREYSYCCCQNCKWYDDDLSKGFFVCMGTLAPVRLNLTQVCVEWRNSDGKVLDDYPERENFPFKFHEDIWEKLIHLDEDLSFEELKEIIDNETH